MTSFDTYKKEKINFQKLEQYFKKITKILQKH